MNHRIDAVGGQAAVHGLGQGIDAKRQQVAEPGADQPKGEPENQQHNRQEDRNRENFVGQKLIDLNAAAVLPGFPVFHYGAGAQLINELVTHIRQGRLPVGAQLLLHFLYDMAHHVDLVFRKLQLLHHGPVALHQLGGREARGNPQPLGVILHHVGQRVNRPMYGAGAEVHPFGPLLFLRCLQHDPDQLVHALVLTGGDGDHRHPDLLRKLLHVDGRPVIPDFIHHIQRDDHGEIQLDQL